MLPITKKISVSGVSPIFAFSLLLLLIVLVTLLERCFGWCKLGRATDVVLFIGQTVVGILLAYTTMVSCLFGTHWNWYLIPFCPLAIVLWLVLRQHRKSLYLLFTIVLVIFLLITPISSQLDLPHQHITATFAVRTASNYYRSLSHSLK